MISLEILTNFLIRFLNYYPFYNLLLLFSNLNDIYFYKNLIIMFRGGGSAGGGKKGSNLEYVK